MQQQTLPIDDEQADAADTPELREFRRDLADFIRCFNFIVQTQVPVRDPNNPLRRYKPGLRTIDVMATHKDDGYRIAYAINAKRPSRQTKTRLLAADCDEAWIVCRADGAAVRVK